MPVRGYTSRRRERWSSSPSSSRLARHHTTCTIGTTVRRNIIVGQARRLHCFFCLFSSTCCTVGNGVVNCLIFLQQKYALLACLSLYAQYETFFVVMKAMPQFRLFLIKLFSRLFGCGRTGKIWHLLALRYFFSLVTLVPSVYTCPRRAGSSHSLHVVTNLAGRFLFWSSSLTALCRRCFVLSWRVWWHVLLVDTRHL